MARLNYVPLQSVIVVRPDPASTDKNKKPDIQVDALAEYNRTGKAFKFTQDEIDEIGRVNGGSTVMVLRDPTDEVEDLDTVKVPGSINAQPQTGSNDTPETFKPADDGKAAADKSAKDNDL